MVNIQLKRSGGQLAKTLQASRELDMDEAAIIKKLKALAPADNPQARDELYYTIVINKKESFPVDPALIKGSLKKVIADLEKQLKVADE